MTDRLDPERFDRDMRRIFALVIEVRDLWHDAAEGGVYAPRGESNGRGKGFFDLRPTESAAHSITQRQLRGAARHSAHLVHELVADLEEAASVLHSAMLRTDPEVLRDYLDKRRAATQ